MIIFYLKLSNLFTFNIKSLYHKMSNKIKNNLKIKIMKTKKLEKFHQEIAGLSVEELQNKRKEIIKKRRKLFIWGINGTWIGGFLALLLVLVIQNLGYTDFPSSLWLLISLYLLCFSPFTILIAKGMKTSDTWLICKRLRELGSEPDLIN